MFPTKGGRLERGLEPVHRRQRAILIALSIIKDLALFVRESLVRNHPATVGRWSLALPRRSAAGGPTGADNRFDLVARRTQVERRPVVRRHLDLARLGRFPDGDAQRQDARGVVSGEIVCIERLAQEKLSREGSRWALGDDDLRAIRRHVSTLRP